MTRTGSSKLPVWFWFWNQQLGFFFQKIMPVDFQSSRTLPIHGSLPEIRGSWIYESLPPSNTSIRTLPISKPEPFNHINSKSINPHTKTQNPLKPKIQNP
ncbi:hypothetical protein Dsin_030072 [Dipteronia sinensis]|uniref:Uncharacterized protein n=1 Tax=Dipteronia sinensis TaxID=43782 RepID=A0AAD9ZII2_9ROSI|nr:hypothetical protein Dsin_030072 [Dipteronia sinensis]